MGLVETVVEHLSIKTALLGPLALLVVYHVYKYVSEMIRVRRLGVPGYQIEARLPFSLDIILKDMKAAKEEKCYERWLEATPAEKGIFTGEARLLSRRVVFTSEPENIKAILATQFADYGKGEYFHKQWKPFLGDSIFATDGDKWHASRQLIRPQFVKDRVSDLHCFEKHTQVLFRAVANGGPLNSAEQQVNLSDAHGQVLEISELLFRYTLDTTTDFLLGHTVSSLSNPKEEFAEAFNEVQRVQNIISRIGPMAPFISHKSYNAGLKVINRFVNNFIDAALLLPQEELASKARDSDSSYTFLHELASFTRDPVVLRDQIVAVLLAGRDTTAGTLSWAFYELGSRPDVVARLREEILAVVGPDRPPTYADLKGIRYLQNVLQETLRLYPAVPYNVRFALHDTTLPRGGGPDGTLPLPVLKDTAIAYSTFVMQRRPDLYPPPDQARGLPAAHVFEPERWQHWQPKPWQYVPFNGGPRICIGQQFALTIMGYVLVRFFQRFDRVETVKDMGPPTLRTDITISPGGPGVRVRFFEAKRE